MDLVEAYSGSSLGSHRTEERVWEEFHEAFYNRFFFATIIEEKIIELMAMEHRDMTVVEYHPRFLALEWFAPGTFQSERQSAVSSCY